MPMNVINLSAIVGAPLTREPYSYFIGSNVLKPEAVAGLMADFPTIRQAGFYPLSDIAVGGSFKNLVADLDDDAFSQAVGEKLEMDLVTRPKLITLRRWSSASDGRIHTDSASKIATTLIYLNEQWADNGAGRLRVLRQPGDFNDYAAEISPVAGNVFGFKRGENSWHGHLPFAGERKVVQITWLIDDSKVTHKTRTAKFTRWLKRLNPWS